MTKRNQFLSFFIKECSGLNYVLPSYIYSELAHLPATEPLEILIDPEDWSSMLYVISNGKAIRALRTSRTLYAQKIKITFSDSTSLILMVMTKIERNGMVLMKANQVLESAVQLPDAIKVPVPCHQFEYILFKSLLIKRDMEEKYRSYFKDFDAKVRRDVFSHIIPKYKFVINLIEDLFYYDKKFYRKINYTLAVQKENRGWRFLLHETFFFSSLLFVAILNSGSWISDKFRISISGKPVTENLKAFLPRKV